MNRKRLLALLSAYFIMVIAVALLVGSQGTRLTLSLSAGSALFWLGTLLGGAAVVILLIWNLRKQQRRLLAERQPLEAANASQAAVIGEQASTISSQVTAIQQYQHAINEQQEFRRALNHELRNPVTAIQTGLERLKSDCDASTVARLKTDTERVSHLLETVNALSRLETDPIERVPVQLDEIIQQAAEMIQATPAAHGCGWVMDLPREPFPLPPVSGDEDLLFIMVHNLLNNAVKFTLENCEVVIRAFEDSRSVVLQVCDNGMGMSEEDQANIGKAFHRGQTALNQRIGGSGLGLYQVWKIVARHGGQISCHSAVGKGTVMTVRLPLDNVTGA